MFGTRLVDRNPAVFQPRVAPEPEIQERLEERLRIATLQMQRRRNRPYAWRIMNVNNVNDERPDTFQDASRHG